MKAEFQKWFTYQKERYPVFKNGLFLFLWALAGISVSTEGALPWGDVILKGTVLTLFFFSLRVFDEFKDAEEDQQFRPHLPVPRGLVRLGELRNVGIALAITQFLIVGTFMKECLPLFSLGFLYMVLMSKEFFIPEKLKEMPLVYAVSHMAIMPIMAMFITGFNPEYLPFWAISLFAGFLIEFGRKLKLPEDEAKGRETYATAYGFKGATMLWTGSGISMLMFLGVQLLQFQTANTLAYLTLVLAPLLMLSFGGFLLSNESKFNIKFTEATSGILVLFSYGLISLYHLLPIPMFQPV